MRVAAAGLGLMTLMACAACGASAPAPRRSPTQEEWTRARAALAELRATEPTAPYVANVRITLHEPRSGRDIDGRGAIAVDPERALRMQLVGPSGLTALDAWVTPNAWRFESPHMGQLRRNGRSTVPPRGKSGAGQHLDDGQGSEARGLPIGFFRWWFLAPLEGELLTSSSAGRQLRFLLRRAHATVDLRTWMEGPLRRIVAVRSEAGQTEELDWTGRALTPSAGDRASYVHRGSGLRVDVVVESVGGHSPDPAAFVDPGGEAGSAP